MKRQKLELSLTQFLSEQFQLAMSSSRLGPPDTGTSIRFWLDGFACNF